MSVDHASIVAMYSAMQTANDEVKQLLADHDELLAALKDAQFWIGHALDAFEGEPGPSEIGGKNLDARICALVARIEADRDG